MPTACTLAPTSRVEVGCALPVPTPLSWHLQAWVFGPSVLFLMHSGQWYVRYSPGTELVYVEGDKSALRPSGLRLGTPALTSRGLVEKDFQKVASFIHRGKDTGLEICHSIWYVHGVCVTGWWRLGH